MGKEGKVFGIETVSDHTFDKHHIENFYLGKYVCRWQRVYLVVRDLQVLEILQERPIDFRAPRTIYVQSLDGSQLNISKRSVAQPLPYWFDVRETQDPKMAMSIKEGKTSSDI